MATLTDETIHSLRRRLRGELLLPDEPGFQEAIFLWNATISKEPALVVRPVDTADVLAAVDFARGRELAVSVRGGGHNLAGTALADGGLTIDMSRLRGIVVDPDAQTAIVEPGCLLGEMDREAQRHGLATPLGFISEVGVAGLTLGGGLGYLTRRFGWSVDNLLEVEVVTADGLVRKASRGENPDLFWAIRGAGANFGVVTSFTFALHEVGPTVYGGLIAWPFERAEEILETYRTVTTESPRELAVWHILMHAPPAPFVPTEWHGRKICAMAVCFSGDLGDVDEALAPVRALGDPVFDLLREQTYVEVQSYLDMTEPKGIAHYWKTENLAELSDDLLATLQNLAGESLPEAEIGILHIGGALNEHDEHDGAVGNRDARYAIGSKAMWDPGEPDPGRISEWVRAAWEQIRPFSTGRTYINFQAADEDDGQCGPRTATTTTASSRSRARTTPTTFSVPTGTSSLASSQPGKTGRRHRVMKARGLRLHTNRHAEGGRVEHVQTAVVGGGHAGLATSRELGKAGVEHLVLERDRVGATWGGLWDSFCLVTPNWSVQLPDGHYDGAEPDGFMPRDEVVSFLRRYAAGFEAPVREGVDVASVEADRLGGFVLRTSEGDLAADSVVVATGTYRRAHRPVAAATLPADLLQIDVADYRNEQALPPGPILVVGSGQSGCQIAEELLEAGREVFLACGKAPWLPRRFGGRDLVWWALETGFLDMPPESLPTPAARFTANVLSSGRVGGHDLHLRTLRAMGVTLTGHFLGAKGNRAWFAADLGETVAWGDERHEQFMHLVRKLVAERGLEPPRIEPPAPFDPSAPEQLDLAGFGAVVFAGGFRPSFGSLLPWPRAFDGLGFPLQCNGASTVIPGLYFMGVHFMRKRKSATLVGAGEDAAIVARSIAELRRAAA